MSEQKNPLDELFVDENETLSNEAIKEILIDYIQLTPQGKMFLLSAFNDLTNDKKMLVLLLAKKALKIKINSDEKMAPKELIETSGLGTGTVSPTLTALIGKRLVIKTDGKYTIPNNAVHRIRELFNTESKK